MGGRMVASRLRVFALACSLLLPTAGPAAGPAAAPADPPPQFLRRPDIHGDQVVFTSEGDLWLGSVSAGTASRITSADGVEDRRTFRPTGN